MVWWYPQRTGLGEVMFAFFEPTRGPENLYGVALYAVRPGDSGYSILHIDWWQSKQHFVDGKLGFANHTVWTVHEQYPDIQFVRDRATAIRYSQYTPEELSEHEDYTDVDWELVNCYTES